MPPEDIAACDARIKITSGKSYNAGDTVKGIFYCSPSHNGVSGIDRLILQYRCVADAQVVWSRKDGDRTDTFYENEARVVSRIDLHVADFPTRSMTEPFQIPFEFQLPDDSISTFQGSFTARSPKADVSHCVAVILQRNTVHTARDSVSHTFEVYSGTMGWLDDRVHFSSTQKRESEADAQRELRCHGAWIRAPFRVSSTDEWRPQCQMHASESQTLYHFRTVSRGILSVDAVYDGNVVAGSKMNVTLHINNETNIYDSNLECTIRFLEKISAEANHHTASRKVEYLSLKVPIGADLKTEQRLLLTVPHVQETSVDQEVTRGLLAVEHLLELEITTPIGVDNFRLALPVHLTKVHSYRNAEREAGDLQKQPGAEVASAPPCEAPPPAYEAVPLYGVPRDPALATNNDRQGAPAAAPLVAPPTYSYEVLPPPAYQSVGLDPIPLSPAQRFRRTSSMNRPIVAQRVPRVHAPADIRRRSEERARVNYGSGLPLEMPQVPALPIMPRVPVHNEPVMSESPRRSQTSRYQV